MYNQRGKKTLDLLYSKHRDEYKALPHPTFGKSNHNSILLIPAYKQKLKQEAQNKKKDCFASTDWNMFQDSSDGIDENTTAVIGFINRCIEDDVRTVTVRTYPNQKPWITGKIRTELRLEMPLSRSVTNPEAYKKSCYVLRRTIKQIVSIQDRSNRITPTPTLVGCGRACKSL